MSNFRNKVAFITGGSSGIGLASAILLAKQGAHIAIADVDEVKGKKAVVKVCESGGDCIFIKCDVSKAEDCERAVKETVFAYGRLDIAFNNAGIGGEQALVADYSVAGWQHIINVNLSGVWYCMKYELQQMLKQKSGAIVNMSSILGQVGFANASGYVAAKHGVIGMTKAAALEYATSGIRINAICPGFIETPLLESAGITDNTPAGEAIKALHPVKRMGTAEEVANAFLYLVSDEASFTHGTALAVDGGYLIQ